MYRPSMTPSMLVVYFLLYPAHLVAAVPNGIAAQKRATSTSSVAPPTRSDIPLLFDQHGRYIIPVGMSTGADEQHFNFTLATSTGMTSVAGTGCSSCSGVDLYNQSASDTAKSLQGSDSVSFVGGSFNGSVIKEDCSMKTANGSAWQYLNQTIVVANAQNNASVFANGVSGVLGLGTNRIPTTSSNSSGFTPTFDDTIYGQWLLSHPGQDAFHFGLDIQPPVITPTSSSGQATASPTSTSAGTLHWLEPDTSAYNTDKIVYKNVQANESVVYASGSQPDWSVLLDGWTFNSGGNQLSNSQQMMSTMDPYYTDIYFPLEEAQLINSAISGSNLQTDLSTLAGQTQTWTVPCDASFSFSVQIDSETFTLDQSVLVIKLGDGSCASAIEGWVDSSVEEYLFGSLFISQIYVTCTISSNGTDTMGFAPRVVFQKSSDVGAIVGGTIGGVAGVLLIGVAAFFFIRSRQDRAMLRDVVAYVEEHKAARAVEPYTIGASAPVTPLTVMQFGSPPGSPGINAPLLQHEHGNEGEDVAPPSYEASEVGTSQQVRSEARTTKGEYVVTTADQPGASSSGEQGALRPNRVYTIEE